MLTCVCLACQNRIVVAYLIPQVELGEAPPQPPVEEGPCLLPRHHAADDTHGLHAAGRVVQVGELHRHLWDEGRERDGERRVRGLWRQS